MSLWIKLRVGSGSDTAEGETTVPLASIGAVTGDTEVNRVCISKFTAQFALDVAGSLATTSSTHTPAGSTTASTIDATEDTTNHSIPPSTRTAALAIDAGDRADCISATSPITIYSPPEAINAECSRNGMSMMVTILTPSGQATTIKVSRRAKIGHLRHIWRRIKPSDVKVEDEAFCFGDRVLASDMKLEQYGIENGDTILVGKSP